MAEDIQGLLEKIRQDGICKAEQEKDTILAEAKTQAQSIISEAKKEAELLTAKAAENAAAEEKKAKDAIRQAARDAVLALRSDLLAKLNAVTKSCVCEAMNEDTLSGIILEMAAAYRRNPNEESSVEFLLSEKSRDAAEKVLKAKLLDCLKKEPVIRLTNEFDGGLQLSFKGNDVFFDFSDEALAEVLCRFVGEKLAAVIKG